MDYMSTDFELIAQAVFLLGHGQTDRQTRLNALPHAGGYTAVVGKYNLMVYQ